MCKDATEKPKPSQDIRPTVTALEEGLREIGNERMADFMLTIRNCLDDAVTLIAAGESEIVRLQDLNAALHERVGDLQRKLENGRWS